MVDLVPPPEPRRDIGGEPRALDDDFSGFAFKIQANIDPAHRDHVAFVRVCSGKFQRGMVRATSSAWSNASDLAIGDTLYLGDEVEFPRIPAFAARTVRHCSTPRRVPHPNSSVEASNSSNAKASSRSWVDRLTGDHPDWTLEPILTGER